MGWTFTEDVEEYAREAGPLLAARPAEHTVSLTVIETARAREHVASPAGEPEIFGWWTGATGAVRGAVSHTPPYELLLGVVPDEAMRPLAQELLGRGRRPAGVNGAIGSGLTFAAVWSALTGDRVLLGVAMRLYRLERLVPPDPAPPGRARLATVGDTDLLVEWFHGFNQDAGVVIHDAPAAVADRLRYGGLMLWQDEDGAPVSLAGRTRTAAGMVRIGPVYTPPERRRRGWGAAVTAAISRDAQDHGAREVVLFTDLANPTSNELYRRLGYRAVSDRAALTFEATP